MKIILFYFFGVGNYCHCLRICSFKSMVQILERAGKLEGILNADVLLQLRNLPFHHPTRNLSSSLSSHNRTLLPAPPIREKRKFDVFGEKIIEKRRTLSPVNNPFSRNWQASTLKMTLYPIILMKRILDVTRNFCRMLFLKIFMKGCFQCILINVPY